MTKGEFKVEGVAEPITFEIHGCSNVKDLIKVDKGCGHFKPSHFPKITTQNYWEAFTTAKICKCSDPNVKDCKQVPGSLESQSSHGQGVGKLRGISNNGNGLKVNPIISFALSMCIPLSLK